MYATDSSLGFVVAVILQLRGHLMPEQFIAVNERGRRIGDSHQSRPPLTDADVDRIHQLREAEPGYWNYNRLAEAFEVSKSCIAGICQGRRRSQLPARFKVLKNEH